MSRLRLAKKLQPAKKAWKGFSNTLQSKLHKLSINAKTIKTTLQRLLSTLHSLRHLIPSRPCPSLTTRTRRPYAACYPYQVHRNNFAAISIDDLFAEPASSFVPVVVHNANKSATHAQGETLKRRGKEVILPCGHRSSGSGMNSSIEDAWKAVVAKSPQLRVDDRAEEFIYKFHQDMKLHKQRSLIEFQEMLARSA